MIQKSSGLEPAALPGGPVAGTDVFLCRHRIEILAGYGVMLLRADAPLTMGGSFRNTQYHHLAYNCREYFA